MATKKERKFIGSNCKNFTSANHAQYQRLMHTKVSTVAAALTHVSTELMTEWEANINAEIEINRAAAAQQSTQKLIEFDADRDRTASFVFGAIDAAINSPVAAQRAAAEYLKKYVIAPYRGMQREAYETETLHITGFLLDAEKAENKVHFQALNLTSALIQLEEQNQLFESYRLQVGDLKVLNTLESSKVVRPRTDANHGQACDMIYASYMLATESADIAKLETLIDEMNRITAEFKTLDAQTQRSATTLTVRGTTKAIVIVNLPKGEKYRVVDIAKTTVAEGISAGARIEVSVPVGIYTVWCNEVKWEKEITVK